MRRHGQLAGSKHPANTLLGRHTQWAQRIPNVWRGIYLGEFDGVGIPNRLHAQRPENMLAQEVPVVLAGNDLHDAARDDEIRVRILPLGAGVKVERLLAPGVDDLLRGFGPFHRGHHVVFGPVVLVAGGVRENFADGHLIASREAGNVFADRIVNAQFALFLQKQNRRRRELF